MRRVCPPQGLRCTRHLETPATPQTWFACVVSRGSPEENAEAGTTSSSAVLLFFPPSCHALRDNAGCDGKRWARNKSWCVLVDLSHTATCVWLAASGVETGGDAKSCKSFAAGASRGSCAASFAARKTVGRTTSKHFRPFFVFAGNVQVSSQEHGGSS
jgi:hypothetical protein